MNGARSHSNLQRMALIHNYDDIDRNRDTNNANMNNCNNASSNGWWGEQQIVNLNEVNLDEVSGSDFDLSTYLGEDQDGLSEDELKNKKMDAFIYSQLQLEDAMGTPEVLNHSEHHHDYDNDFANVPYDAIDNMEYRSVSQPSASTVNSSSYVRHMERIAPMQQYPSTSESEPIFIVKEEPIDHQHDLKSDLKIRIPMPSVSRASSVSSGTYAPDSIMNLSSAGRKPPRKYVPKPEVEKQRPGYKIKREKNNDAVRRSREKSKRVQELKDHRLMELEHENDIIRCQLAELQDQNAKIIQNCRCGAAAKIIRR